MSQNNIMSLRIGLIALTIGGTLIFAAVWFTVYQPSQTKTPDVAQTRKNLQEAREAALHYITSDQIPQAKKILEAILKDFPSDADAHLLMAKVMIAESNPVSAYEHVVKALEVVPSDAEAHFLAGRLAQETHKLDKAKYHYTQAGMLAPNEAKYPLYLASVLMEQTDLDAAQLQLLRTLRLDASLAVAYSMQAEIAARRGKLDMAIGQINKALEQTPDDDPKHITYLLQKSQLLRRANDPDSSLAILMQLPPEARSRVDVAEHLADSYMMKGEPAKAAIAWTDAFTANPQNAQAAAQAGVCFLRADDRQRAQQYLGLAERLDKHNPTVRALRKAVEDSAE